MNFSKGFDAHDGANMKRFLLMVGGGMLLAACSSPSPTYPSNMIEIAKALAAGEKANRSDYSDTDPAIEFIAGKLEKNENLSSEKSLSITYSRIEDKLYDLRYYPFLPKQKGSPELTQAIKDFQKDIGKPETGLLTKGEYAALEDKVRDLYMPDFLSGTVILKRGLNPNAVSVRGQWLTVRGRKGIDPIAQYHIDCKRGAEHGKNLPDICFIKSNGVELLPGVSPLAFFLKLKEDVYPIKKWDNQGLVAVDEDVYCYHKRVLTIDFSTGDIKLVTSYNRDYPHAAELTQNWTYSSLSKKECLLPEEPVEQSFISGAAASRLTEAKRASMRARALSSSYKDRMSARDK